MSTGVRIVGQSRRSWPWERRPVTIRDKDDWKDLYRNKESEPVPVFEYTQEVLDHFYNPRNVGRIDEPDGIGVAGDPACGDNLLVTIRVDETTDRITDIRFLVYGCAGAVATSSAMTELAKGRTIEEALRLCDDDVIVVLGGLPDHKRHCSLIGIHALHAAVADYRDMRRQIQEGLVKDRAEYRVKTKKQSK